MTRTSFLKSSELAVNLSEFEVSSFFPVLVPFFRSTVILDIFFMTDISYNTNNILMFKNVNNDLYLNILYILAALSLAVV